MEGMSRVASKGSPILLGLSLKVSNLGNALRNIMSLTDELGVEILHIESSRDHNGETYLSCIVVSGEERGKVYRRVSSLKDGSGYIEDVEVVEPRGLFLFPYSNYVKILQGVRQIIIPKPVMRGMILGIRENLGEEWSDQLLHHLGVTIGIKLYQGLPRLNIEVGDVGEAISFLGDLFKACGWGGIIEADMGGDVITLKLDMLFECDIQRGYIDRPASRIVKGLFEGFIREHAKRPVSVRETRCIAIGDEYCQFEIEVF